MRVFKLTEEQRQIAEDNHNLIYGFAHQRNLDVDDWYGQLAVELCRSIKDWDMSRGTLSTYFYMRAEAMFNKDYRGRHYHKRKANENTGELNLGKLHDMRDDVEENIILEEILGCGNRKVLRMRYEGYTQNEIADELGISQPKVSELLAESLETYRKGCDRNHE